LYAVCKRAGELNEPPFRALFAALDEVRNAGNLYAEQYAALTDYVMRIGDAAKSVNRGGNPVDLVEQLRHILEVQGITVLDPSEDGEEDVAEARQEASPRKKSHPSGRRRVSFDDANFEETWLDEHSRPVNPTPLAAPTPLLSLPPRRGRNMAPERRTRSTSAQRGHPNRRAAPKSSQHNVPDPHNLPDIDAQLNPTLYFEPSQTQLELNAEVFLSTAALRSARHALHAWHNSTLRRQSALSKADATAIAHDRRTLLKQAFDQWRAALSLRIQELRKEHHLERLCDRAKHFRDRFLLNKAFTHWAMSCEEEKLRQKVAQRHILRVTYFRRWRAIAAENQAKVRSILVRKYVAVWRAKTARRLHWEEQAEAHYEERLMKKYKSAWFWHFCSRRVEGWHEQWIEKKGFRRLFESYQASQARERQAGHFYSSHLRRRALRHLTTQLHSRRDDEALVCEHRERVAALKCLSALHMYAKVQPLGRQVVRRLDESAKRKAFRIWRQDLALSRQADEVNRSRILQNAWTNWNESLRCKALAQKIDERVLMESLYRWILQERLTLFQRTANVRLLGRAFAWWRGKVAEERDQLGDAERLFQERQRRRRLAYGMRQLNMATRSREDAERAAVEFSNSRALPKTLDAWKMRTNHAGQLAKWAADARYYCLCSGVLRVWKERTTEHKANRRRDAYIEIRARIKIKLVTNCFAKLRTACTNIRSMSEEADRRVQAGSADAASKAFTHWREETARYSLLDTQALDLDHQKLLSSALAAITLAGAHLASLDQQAHQFRRNTDLALEAGALRRLQWATFTTSRKVESADALWARNRDQHIRHMLRHWAAQTGVRRAAAAEPGEITEIQGAEPESPSLRPASRAASRSALPDIAFASSPPTQMNAATTPSYLRTPSRPRRAGRFRPLPAPAPITPMAFDSALLATSPAPLPTIQQPNSDERRFAGLTPGVTPFSRKLRAGGFPQPATTAAPASAIRSAAFQRTVQIGTGKSVRFAGSGRFGKMIFGEGGGSSS
jgi:protein SFI1